MIYFFGTEDETIIKIGETGDPAAKRRRELQQGPFAPTLIFLAGVHGTRKDEASCHRYFADLAFEGEKEWFNPPFSQWDLWAPKAVGEWLSGRVTQMCILMNTVAMTALQVSRIHAFASALCVLEGRHQFWGDNPGISPRAGHVVFYLGPNPDRFAIEFENLGHLWFGTCVGTA